jgi:hypothetical protein
MNTQRNRTMNTQNAIVQTVAPAIAELHEVHGLYGQIIGWTNGPVSLEEFHGQVRYAVRAETILERFADCLPEPYRQQHGRRRSEKLSLDLYAYDPEQGVAIVQARRHSWDSKHGFGQTRKTYFLCGHNEITGAPFRHPISAAAVHGAVRRGLRGAAIVRAVQSWMWSVTLTQLDRSIRQGDVLLVPERSAPKGGTERGHVATLADSHEVHATRVVEAEDGRLWALDPIIYHTKGQHETVHGCHHDGWCTIRVAREAPAWDFARRLGD